MTPFRWLVAYALTTAVASSQSPAQTESHQPIQTNLCELLSAPERFTGKLVEFRADFVTKFQWEGFLDAHCSARLQLGGSHPLDELTPEQGQYAFTTDSGGGTQPHHLNWKPIPPAKPIQLKKTTDYVAMRKWARAKFRWPDGGICQDCPLYRVQVNATGRLDHFDSAAVAVRQNPSADATIYSFLDAPLDRLVLESVSDVSAVPIPRTLYTAAKPRGVTLEEAHNLVMLASGCIHGDCTLVQYQADSKFYQFQAVGAAPPGANANRGFFAVDPRTGNVSSGVVCEIYASPPLVKLQRAIRKRIGLTDPAYEGMAKTGPFCFNDDKPRVNRANHP